MALLFWLEGTLEGGELIHQLELTPRPDCSDRADQGCVFLGFENPKTEVPQAPWTPCPSGQLSLWGFSVALSFLAL